MACLAPSQPLASLLRPLPPPRSSSLSRLVSITSSSPFLPSHTPSSSTSPPSPTLSTSTLSTTPWRPTPDQPVRIISLASALDPHQSPSAFLRANGYSTTTNGTRAGRRPASSHSLKTLTRSGATTARQQNGRPSPLGRRPTSDGEFDDGVQEEEEEDREGGIDLYGTVASYRTAREGTIGRGTLKGLWDGYDEGAEERELTPEEHDQLKKRNEQVSLLFVSGSRTD